MTGMAALVLVVDDSPSIRAQIRGVLQQVEGFDEFIEAGIRWRRQRQLAA